MGILGIDRIAVLWEPMDIRIDIFFELADRRGIRVGFIDRVRSGIVSEGISLDGYLLEHCGCIKIKDKFKFEF